MSCILHLIKRALDTEVSNGLKVVRIVFSETESCDVTAIKEIPEDVGVEEYIVEQGGISCLQSPQDESFRIIIIRVVLLLHVVVTLYGHKGAFSEGQFVH